MSVDISSWREAASLIVVAKCPPSQAQDTESDSSSKKDQLSDYRLLLTKRSGKSSYLANAFCFPGGHIEQADFSPNWWSVFEKCGHSRESVRAIGTSISGPRPPIVTEPQALKDRSDKDQLLPTDIALRVSAIREAFEETGILISRGGQVSSAKVDLKQWQKRVHDEPTSFAELFLETRTCPDIWSLKEWWNWLTPAAPGHKRFDTMFYLACLEAIPETRSDGNEVSTMEWHTAQEVLELHGEGGAFLAPPQVYELARLANFPSFEGLRTFAQNREKLGVERWCAKITGLLDGAILAMPGDDYYTIVLSSSASTLPTLDEARKKSRVMNRMELRAPVLTPICANLRLPCGHLCPVPCEVLEDKDSSPTLRSRL